VEEIMKRPAKSYSFDAMVKFFIQYYQIPTKYDIEKLMTKLDNLEKTIASLKGKGHVRAKDISLKGTPKKTTSRSAMTAIDTVLGIIKRHRNGADIPTIKKKSGLDDKAVRNAIFRLTKQNKIARKSRGVYVVTG
jgi:hypothetical protein